MICVLRASFKINMDPELLLQVCQRGDVDTLRVLIAAGISLERTKNQYGYTVLMIGSRHPEIVDILLSAGANCNTQDNLGNTCLHYVVIWNKIDVATLLLNAGADRNIPNNKGHTCTQMPTHLNDTASFIRDYIYPGEDIKDPGFL